MKYLLLMLVLPLVSHGSYSAQTLDEQVKAADIVVHARIVVGQAHEFSHHYHVHGRPLKKHLKHMTCGYSYKARIIEAFKGDVAVGEVLEFTAIESFGIGSQKLLFLSDSESVLFTDSTATSSSAGYNRKEAACKKHLPVLYSHHLSTADFVDHYWVNVSAYHQLPENIYQSPALMAWTQKGKSLAWNKGPQINFGGGPYSRWQEFRKHLLQIVGGLP